MMIMVSTRFVNEFFISQEEVCWESDLKYKFSWKKVMCRLLRAIGWLDGERDDEGKEDNWMK